MGAQQRAHQGVQHGRNKDAQRAAYRCWMVRRLAAVLAAAAVRVERGAALSSRGCMWTGGVPAGLTAIPRVVLVGDRLSWERPRAGWGQEASARVRGE